MTASSGDRADPLIVTAAFDPTSAAIFQDLRTRHFPRALDRVPAHLTLFHRLPGSEHDAIATTVEEAGEGLVAMPFMTTGFRFLGRGVAIEIDAPALVALRARLAARWRPCARLAARWRPWLTAQDGQPFRPHVTVQNKADPAAARLLFEDLAAAFVSVAGLIVGLDLWHYRGGPWDQAGAVRWG